MLRITTESCGEEAELENRKKGEGCVALSGTTWFAPRRNARIGNQTYLALNTRSTTEACVRLHVRLMKGSRAAFCRLHEGAKDFVCDANALRKDKGVVSHVHDIEIMDY